MATHSNNVAWRTPKDRGAGQAVVHEMAKGWTVQLTFTVYICIMCICTVYVCTVYRYYMYS